jgi:hypothetical protein
MITNLNELLRTIIDKLLPLKTIKVKKPPAPWTAPFEKLSKRNTLSSPNPNPTITSLRSTKLLNYPPKGPFQKLNRTLLNFVYLNRLKKEF